MNDHPVNLLARFLMEIAAVVAFGLWGWEFGGALRLLWAICLPVLSMSIWTLFRVPGDPGKAPIAVRGRLRLALEALFFGAAVAALFTMDLRIQAWAFLILLLVHYAVSYDRVVRLIQK